MPILFTFTSTLDMDNTTKLTKNYVNSAFKVTVSKFSQSN